MQALIGSLGIIFNTIGVVLMIRYGLPYPLRSLELGPDSNDGQRVEQDRRSLIGAVGLVLFIIGNVLFLMSNGWNSN